MALAAALCAACGSGDTAPPTRWLDRVDEELPASLAGVGIYAELTGLVPAGDAVAYTPQHPLYSNGLDKQRLLHLPAGSTVDASGDDYAFPTGTVLVKTFTLGGRPVETRLLFRRAERWDYALYAWRSDGADADLREGNWPEEPLTLGGGLAHTLPARLDCRTCHETHEAEAGSPVLGLSALQLDETLAETGALSDPPRLTPVQGRSATETAALGYFVGNCVACHNGGGALNASFSLYPAAAVTETVDRPTESETGVGVRVVPGVPAESVLYESVVLAPQAGYTGPFKAMPPLGVDVPDPAAEALLRAWIESL